MFIFLIGDVSPFAGFAWFLARAVHVATVYVNMLTLSIAVATVSVNMFTLSVAVATVINDNT